MNKKSRLKCDVKVLAECCIPVLLCILAVMLSSCAVPLSLGSEKCRNFPFEKKFPGCDHPPTSFYYDQDYKWFTGRDGLMVRFSMTKSARGARKCTIEHDVYNDNLGSTVKETQYHAAYQAMEEEFDRKYAGWIKRELLSVSDYKINYWKEKKKYVVKKDEFDRTWLPRVNAGLLKYTAIFDADTKKKYDGSFSIEYPNYLEGKELPEGLQTPSSFFSSEFLSHYATTDEHGGRFLFDHVRSYRLINGGHFYWDTNRLEEKTVGLIFRRFMAQYAEYVLTYYYLQEYNSFEARSQIGCDLAAFYREVAFRAAAEASYVYADSTHWLNNREKCAVANLIANRLHDYILIAFTDPEAFKEIRQKFEPKLDRICHSNLAYKRSITLGPDCIVAIDPRCVSEAHRKNREIRKSIEESEERCVND